MSEIENLKKLRMKHLSGNRPICLTLKEREVRNRASNLEVVASEMF